MLESPCPCCQHHHSPHLLNYGSDPVQTPAWPLLLTKSQWPKFRGGSKILKISLTCASDEASKCGMLAESACLQADIWSDGPGRQNSLRRKKQSSRWGSVCPRGSGDLRPSQQQESQTMLVDTVSFASHPRSCAYDHVTDRAVSRVTGRATMHVVEMCIHVWLRCACVLPGGWCVAAVLGLQRPWSGWRCDYRTGPLWGVGISSRTGVFWDGATWAQRP